ncbi:cupin domain-containing protein [Acetobacteraceae bacterium H6797]|nr:cupin domain-containing protein [Acetobacteraceae bacterium H6797]
MIPPSIPASGNLLHLLPDASAEEIFETLLQRPGCRLERITSHGQASPPGFWYEQSWDEWVLLLAGHARIDWAGERMIELRPGDSLLIPADTRHRVDFTTPDAPTVWLALHLGEPG